jgi:hypothetical protein
VHAKATEFADVDCYGKSLGERLCPGSSVTSLIKLTRNLGSALQDFRQKMKRGGGLGVNFRDMKYWKKVQAQCVAGLD